MRGVPDVSDVMRRLVKENLRTFEGRRLFPKRYAHSLNFEESFMKVGITIREITPILQYVNRWGLCRMVPNLTLYYVWDGSGVGVGVVGSLRRVGLCFPLP